MNIRNRWLDLGRRCFLAAALLPIAGSAACSGSSLTKNTEGDAPPIDHPPLDPSLLPVAAASSRRVSVAQLRGSLPVVAGNDLAGAPITWKLDNGSGGLGAMSGALGVPNYASSTTEDREPSPVYAKLMDDAARSVCDQALAADKTRPASERVILRHVEPTDTTADQRDSVDDNLRYLRLRMHGMRVQASDDAPIAPLRAVFDAAVTEASAGKPPTNAAIALGWRAVCVALLVAPEFHLY